MPGITITPGNPYRRELLRAGLARGLVGCYYLPPVEPDLSLTWRLVCGLLSVVAVLINPAVLATGGTVLVNQLQRRPGPRS